MAATAVKTLVSEEEYLRGPYGDRTPEYVDGEIVERTMPNNLHSEVQVELGFAFRKLRNSHGVHVRSELRLRVAPARYRIPDLVVYWPEKPVLAIPDETPFVVIEIVSPDDPWTEITTKLKEYFEMGVTHVWLVDPQTRSLVTYGEAGLGNVKAFELPEFGLKITIDDLLP